MAFTPIAIRDGNNAAQSMAAFQDAAGYNYSSFVADGAQAVYRAGALFTPYATAAATLINIKGSATKTVRIRRLVVSYVATANAGAVLALQRTSTAGTGGTAVTPTVSKLDTSSAAASAVVTHYTTAAQSNGSATGGPLSVQLVTGALVALTSLTISAVPVALFPEGGILTSQSIVLRGASDYLEVQNQLPTNLSSGTQIGYFVEWVEDAS